MAGVAGKRVRLVDVARRAGVTATLVSQVLRGGGSSTTRVSARTATRIRRVARQMGYRPNVLAQQLKGQSSDVLGVLIGADTTPANARRLAAIELAARARGWRLMIGQFHRHAATTRDYLHDFLSRGIQALIAFHNPAPLYDTELLPLLMQFRAAVFQTHAPWPQACVVDVDRAQGVRLACAHLVARGRRRIGLVLNEDPARDGLMADRLRGWREGLLQAELPPDPQMVWCGTGAYPPPPELVAQAAGHLLSAGCDAVIASNDVWALHLIKALRRRGQRVPADMAVIGFDNLDAAELCDPALTSIDQNNPAFGAAAIDLLAAALAEAQLPGDRRRVIVPARLVVRESS